MDFYVYNTETDTVRITTIMPTLKWGGSGCLGAAIGHGYLHALPAKCCGTNGRSSKIIADESESPMLDVREQGVDDGWSGYECVDGVFMSVSHNRPLAATFQNLSPDKSPRLLTLPTAVIHAGTSVFRSPAPHITDATRSSSRGPRPSSTDGEPHTPIVIGASQAPRFHLLSSPMPAHSDAFPLPDRDTQRD